MSFDDWSYDFLWDISGLTAPNLHIDDFQAISDKLSNVGQAVFALSHAVTHALEGLSQLSNAQFVTAFYEGWKNVACPKITHVALEIGAASSGAGQVTEELYYFKSHLVAAVGAYDIAQAAGGYTSLYHMLVNFFDSGARHEAVRRLENLLESKLKELETRIFNLVVNGTGLKKLVEELESEIQSELNKITEGMADFARSQIGPSDRLAVSAQAMSAAISELKAATSHIDDIRSNAAQAPEPSDGHVHFVDLFNPAIAAIRDELPTAVENVLNAIAQALTGSDQRLSEIDQQLAGDANKASAIA